MAELKTKANDGDVRAFIDAVADETRCRDAHALCDIFERLSGEKPRMWGPAIIGFGHTNLKYASGRELAWFVAGFSPRKASLSLYLDCAIVNYADLLTRLGKHKTGKGCLYVDKLAQVDLGVLEEMIRRSFDRAKAQTK